MAIIDCVSWSPQEAQPVYAYKFPENNLSTYTQLIVNESQVALLFSKGELMGKFGPGKHTLSTENLPILRRMYGFPFGGKNPFMAQVWFVNLIETVNNPWSLHRLSVHDPDFQTTLPLMADGQYGLKIIDPEKFLIKMVGTHNIFTHADMTAQFTGEFTTKAKSLISRYIIGNNVGFKQISAYLDPMSQQLREELNDFWSNYGIELTKFYVSNIDIDQSTPEGRKVKEAIATQSSMSITGHTWQQEQMFGTVNESISKISEMGGLGGNGGLLGGIMAINMMNNVTSGARGGGMLNSGMMDTKFEQPRFGPESSTLGKGAQERMAGAHPASGPKMVYCSRCAKKFDANNAFCPHCGSKYNPCPNCGTDNPETARRCVNCGTSLNSEGEGKCPHCHSQIPANCSFCPGCGQPVVREINSCSRCGYHIPPSAKFCPKCGNRK